MGNIHQVEVVLHVGDALIGSQRSDLSIFCRVVTVRGCTLHIGPQSPDIN